MHLIVDYSGNQYFAFPIDFNAIALDVDVGINAFNALIVYQNIGHHRFEVIHDLNISNNLFH
jgi:hypothetical protein